MNSEIIELALGKVREKFSNYEAQLKEHRAHNEKILKENSSFKDEIKSLKSKLDKSEFDNNRLKKALHTRVKQYNTEVAAKTSHGFDSNVNMSNNCSEKEMNERKKSIENFKRINTMGQFEIQKASLENSME